MSKLAKERTSSTNFEFLLLDWELKQEYYDRAKYIEDFYVKGNYDIAIEQAEKFEKKLIKKGIVLETFESYITDNTQKYALIKLRGLYQALKQISIEAGQTVNNDFEDPLPETQYQTNERKLIYIQSVDNTSGKWDVYSGLEKIGDATTEVSEDPLNYQPNSTFLKQQAEVRIRKYMTTSGVPFSVKWAELAYKPNDKINPWFRDHDVHRVLKRSGYSKEDEVEGAEWWKINLDTAKKAITAVKENREVIDGPIISKNTIILRPEQKAAIKETKQILKKKDRMLWNAKMRFGKTLTTYQLVKESEYSKVLILTHRPVVSDSWYEDFNKLDMHDSGYKYGSKKGESIESLVKNESKFVYFASLQDLRGSTQVGGKQGEKNELVFSTNWDLIVFDEAHEGTQTDLAKNVEQAIKKDNTKILELSGTPFNLLEQYSEDQVFTWDYVMEQEAKLRWATEKPDIPNPYESLPKVNMFTFNMKNKEKYSDNKAFNFKEFFRVDSEGLFVHESDVIGFLNEITNKSKNNYPYSTNEYRNELRHTLWLLPGIAEAKALKALMDQHQIFGKEYKVINVVDNDDKEILSKNDPDLGRVRAAISDKPWETKTITLTVRKLTTGVNVKEWSAVMFLNNTTSPMNYLQAAFRAQTPYSNSVQGQKTNVYIFDFAPDRALTVMAESASISSGVGKRNTPEQKTKMSKMLNFLPIIGMNNNNMKAYDVNQMLTQLKRVYAEKAVRSGFDDDSLYSDALLTIDPEAAKMFEKLQGILGNTKASKSSKTVDVNDQGLSDAEYERAEKAKKKQKKDRTPEEQEAIEKQRIAKKQRRNAISILRGISIRIPLLIFGMEVDINKDIDINTFVNEVDDDSWVEFMPDGVTKEMFKEQAVYYDTEVFIEAGRIIRNRAKSFDDLTYAERTEQIALLHSTFKNPDKETVLTPWNVVNMQLVSTIGGLSYYNDDFFNTHIDGIQELSWVEKDETKNVYKSNSKVLEINSKTGLYPLFIATSLFYKQQMKFIDDSAGKISKLDEEIIIQKILKNNIFIIAKTPMAKTITQRTLVGYKDWQTNIIYIPDLVKKISNNLTSVTREVQQAFGGEILKFDAVVGNPPYQETVRAASNGNNANTIDVFPHFQNLANEIGNINSLIYPAKEYQRGSKNVINKHLKSLRIYNGSSKEAEKNIPGEPSVFGDAVRRIPGDVGVFLWDMESESDKILYQDKLISRTDKILPVRKELISIAEKLSDEAGTFKKSKVKKVVESNFVENNKQSVKSEVFDRSSKTPEGFVKVLTNNKAGSGGKAKWFYILRDKLDREQPETYKVIISSAFPNEAFKNPDNLEIISPDEMFGRTKIAIYDHAEKARVEYFIKYLKTNFVKIIVNMTPLKFLYYLPDFDTIYDDIDWEKSVSEIDEQLYQKYNFDDNEIGIIENEGSK